ncbi:MAG TPA: hypothetical protein VGI39_46300 [Polyangiaceae bacterium]
MSLGARFFLAVGVAVLVAVGCGTSAPRGFSSSSSSDDAGSPPLLGDGATPILGNGSDAGPTSGPSCPAGLQCNASCSGGATTTLSGTVYDPAARHPLYNVTVYVPSSPLTPLPKGIPSAADACACSALFQSGALTSTATGVDGTFQLTNVPVGANVPLVLQIGKWRRALSVPVTACQDNPQPDKSLALPSSVGAANPDDNLPDIAVSTGEADSLECLMRRIGLPASEYVAGAGGSGHVHVFSGGRVGAGSGPDGGKGSEVGKAEPHGMPGAPASDQALWSSAAQLAPYDILLLSCEGGETYNANPSVLEAYLNAGGRAFASHFHYAWFTGPLGTGQSYSAPADWGANLASWSTDSAGGGCGMGGGSAIGGSIVQTLNGGTAPFAKGHALAQWLGVVGALGQDGVPATDLSIYQPRFNAQVSASNAPSQPWITSGACTMYFSFDTPVNAPVGDGGVPLYCGRAVFSDLHVAGNPLTQDAPPPPGGCADTDLSPQEKALEFMLFDLSSCVIPDSQPPPSRIP